MHMRVVDDPVHYTIRLKRQFDDLPASSADICEPKPGRRAGLTAYFSETELYSFPPRSSVEVLLSIMGEESLCNTYRDVGIEIVPSCEVSSPYSQIYQYRWERNSTTGEIDIMYGQISRGFKHSSNFSVSWSPSLSRRLDGGGGNQTDWRRAQDMNKRCEQRRLADSIDCESKVLGAEISHLEQLAREYEELRERAASTSVLIDSHTVPALLDTDLLSSLMKLCIGASVILLLVVRFYRPMKHLQ
jgi:hypothetical protein